MSSSIRDLETNSYNFIVKTKMKLLHPFLAILSKLGVTPNMVSFVSGAMGILSLYFFATSKLQLVLIPVLIHIFLDAVDGGLARLKKSDSNHGKFIDLLAGNIFATLFFIGMFIAKIITAPTMLTIITLNTFSEIIAIKYNSTKTKLQSGGLCHLGKIFLITITLVEFQFKIGLDLNSLANITSFYLTLLSFIFLLKIQRK